MRVVDGLVTINYCYPPLPSPVLAWQTTRDPPLPVGCESPPSSIPGGKFFASIYKSRKNEKEEIE